MIPKKQGLQDLLYCLGTYTSVRLVISGFSLSDRRGTGGKLLEQDELKHLDFRVDKTWQLYLNDTFYHEFVPDKDELIKVEYRDERYSRICPVTLKPNDLYLPSVSYSAFRNVVDDYLLEIFFKGKIPLQKIRSDY